MGESRIPGLMPPLFPLDGIWMGAMVPKRWAKRAVTRNAIKRQIYAVSATYAMSLKPWAHLVRLRTSFDRAHFTSAASDALKAEVRTELQQLFTQAVSVGRAA
jgi:ribonuclease P protein component